MGLASGVTLLFVAVAALAPQAPSPKASPVAAVAVEVQTTSTSRPTDLHDRRTASSEYAVEVSTRCLTEAGYEPFGSTRPGLNSFGLEFVLARGASRSWPELFEVYEDVYCPADFDPRGVHLAIGHFVPAFDAPDIENELRQLALARDSLALSNGNPVVACVFSWANEGDTDLEVALTTSNVKGIIDSCGISVFNDELVGLYATSEALKTNLTAAEADLAEEQAARAAAEDRIRAAVERLQLKDDADAADILAALKGDSSGAQD